MTREENLYWLNQEIRTWENECQSKHPIKEALYAARKALEQEQKWTPVIEEPPKKDGLYLVSVKNDHLRRYSKTCWYSDKNWFARQDVVAWMPLPEPYKTESEG
jgi:hypothetical protein